MNHLNNPPPLRLLPDGTETELICEWCTPPPKLIVRTNRRNGGQFLGCPNWPLCYFTREIPEYLRLEIAGQPKLF